MTDVEKKLGNFCWFCHGCHLCHLRVSLWHEAFRWWRWGSLASRDGHRSQVVSSDGYCWSHLIMYPILYYIILHLLPICFAFHTIFQVYIPLSRKHNEDSKIKNSIWLCKLIDRLEHELRQIIKLVSISTPYKYHVFLDVHNIYW